MSCIKFYKNILSFKSITESKKRIKVKTHVRHEKAKVSLVKEHLRSQEVSDKSSKISEGDVGEIKSLFEDGDMAGWQSKVFDVFGKGENGIGDSVFKRNETALHDIYSQDIKTQGFERRIDGASKPRDEFGVDAKQFNDRLTNRDHLVSLTKKSKEMEGKLNELGFSPERVSPFIVKFKEKLNLKLSKEVLADEASSRGVLLDIDPTQTKPQIETALDDRKTFSNFENQYAEFMSPVFEKMLEKALDPTTSIKEKKLKDIAKNAYVGAVLEVLDPFDKKAKVKVDPIYSEEVVDSVADFMQTNKVSPFMKGDHEVARKGLLKKLREDKSTFDKTEDPDIVSDYDKSIDKFKKMPISDFVGEAGFMARNMGFLKNRKEISKSIDSFANDVASTSTRLKDRFSDGERTFYVSNNPLDKLTMAQSNSNCVSCQSITKENAGRRPPVELTKYNDNVRSVHNGNDFILYAKESSKSKQKNSRISLHKDSDNNLWNQEDRRVFGKEGQSLVSDLLHTNKNGRKLFNSIKYTEDHKMEYPQENIDKIASDIASAPDTKLEKFANETPFRNQYVKKLSDTERIKKIPESMSRDIQTASKELSDTGISFDKLISEQSNGSSAAMDAAATTVMDNYMAANKDMPQSELLKQFGLENGIGNNQMISNLADNVDLYNGQNLSDLYNSDTNPLSTDSEIMLDGIENLIVSDKGKSASSFLNSSILNSLTKDELYSIMLPTIKKEMIA